MGSSRMRPCPWRAILSRPIQMHCGRLLQPCRRNWGAGTSRSPPMPRRSMPETGAPPAWGRSDRRAAASRGLPNSPARGSPAPCYAPRQARGRSHGHWPAPQNAAAKSVVSAAWTVSPSAFHPLHRLRWGTGRQVTLTRETIAFPGCPLAFRVAGMTSEWWPRSNRNGGRLQLGTVAAIKLE